MSNYESTENLPIHEQFPLMLTRQPDFYHHRHSLKEKIIADNIKTREHIIEDSAAKMAFRLGCKPNDIRHAMRTGKAINGWIIF